MFVIHFTISLVLFRGFSSPVLRCVITILAHYSLIGICNFPLISVVFHQSHCLHRLAWSCEPLPLGFVFGLVFRFGFVLFFHLFLVSGASETRAWGSISPLESSSQFETLCISTASRLLHCKDRMRQPQRQRNDVCVMSGISSSRVWSIYSIYIYLSLSVSLYLLSCTCRAPLLVARRSNISHFAVAGTANIV